MKSRATSEVEWEDWQAREKQWQNQQHNGKWKRIRALYIVAHSDADFVEENREWALQQEGASGLAQSFACPAVWHSLTRR
jgi:hypothetical protein